MTTAALVVGSLWLLVLQAAGPRLLRAVRRIKIRPLTAGTLAVLLAGGLTLLGTMPADATNGPPEIVYCFAHTACTY